MIEAVIGCFFIIVVGAILLLYLVLVAVMVWHLIKLF